MRKCVFYKMLEDVFDAEVRCNRENFDSVERSDHPEMVVPENSRGRDGLLDDGGRRHIVSLVARAGAGGRGLFHADFRAGGGGFHLGVGFVSLVGVGVFGRDGGLARFAFRVRSVVLRISFLFVIMTTSRCQALEQG